MLPLLSMQAGHCRFELSDACRVRRSSGLLRAAAFCRKPLLQRQQLAPELGVVGCERPQLQLCNMDTNLAEV